MTDAPASARSRWDLVLPTRGEVWTFGLGSLIPFAMLAAYRLVIAVSLVPEMRDVDWWRVPVGELEFWALWSFWWTLGFKVFGRFVRRAYRLLFHGTSLFVAVFSLLDLAYFQTAGSRSDWEMLLYGFRDLPRVWPVVSSEMTPGRWALVALVVAVVVSPIFRRWPEGRRPIVALLAWAAVMYPAVMNQVDGRPRAVERLRGLQPGFLETLWWDGLARWDDSTLPPDPAELEPLVLRPREMASRPNLVLLVLESVGARSTTVYDPAVRTTPHLSRLAQGGLVVEQAYTVVPHTSKSLVTTLCGDWPYLKADIREARAGGMPGRCLPELLEEAGYRTAFFQPAREDFEDRVDLVHYMGFDRFQPKAVLQADRFEKSNYFGLDDFSMLDPGMTWSTEAPGQPFFATYLTLASHHAYTLPSQVEPKKWPGVKGRRGEYLAAVHYVDEFVGELVSRYEAAGLLDNTVFLILGDHGEAFGEHGRSQHDLVIWEEGLQIPMLLYGPKFFAPGKIEGDRQQIDVLPTLLELAGLEVASGHLRGSSLLAPAPERVLYHSCWRSYRCLARREGRQKFIDHYREKPMQVFDLAADPEEEADRSKEFDAAQREAWRAEVRDWRSRSLGRLELLAQRWRQSVLHPDDGTPALHRWGGKVDLLGCGPPLQTEVYPGEAVWVRCRWRAHEVVRSAWRIVGRVAAQGVVEEDPWVPGHGEIPVWEWEPGSIIEDDLRVHVPAHAPPGPAKLSVAWRTYSGRRLDDGEDWVPLAQLVVRARINGEWSGASEELGDEIELKP